MSVGKASAVLVHGAWADGSSWRQDRMIDPDTQRFMAQRMNAQVRLSEADHTPSVTAPDLVTEIVVEAIRSVSTH